LLDDTALEKTDSQKIKEVMTLLNSKPQLTETDMQLLKILLMIKIILLKFVFFRLYFYMANKSRRY